MCSRISKLIGLLARLSHSINFPNLKIIYNALILPIFDYGDLIYSTACVKHTTRLQKLQNRACRILLGINPYSHFSIVELHKRVKLKSLSTRRLCHLHTMVFKSLNGFAPDYLQRMFQFRSSNYTLRSNGSLFIPYPKTEFVRK